MRIGSNGNWAFASRDLFKATGCEHCVRLSMAVKAEVASVVEKVRPFEEDLSTKLPIIQGNQRERKVFEQIKDSLPAGDFLELEGTNSFGTIQAMRKLVPVIAQGYFQSHIKNYEWSGYADLLVLEGYELTQKDDGTVVAVKAGVVPEEPKYTPWDVKNASDGDPKYQIQLAMYFNELQELGLASDQKLGIVLGFSKGILRYEIEESMKLYRDSLDALLKVLLLVTPRTITEGFVTSWTCAKKSTCGKVYCDYPGLCASNFKSDRVLELLPNVNHTHGPKIRAAGFSDISALAKLDAVPEIAGLKPEFADRYWNAAKVMQLEFDGQLALMSKVVGSPEVPEPSDGDLFFDVEWFDPVDSTGSFIFMFGVVANDEKFEVFIAETSVEEKEKFDLFLDYALGKLNSHPDMHIYHYNNPEPKKLEMLSERYGGHRAADVEKVNARMFDLMKVTEASFVPGSGSYSIKSLETYYDADSKLHRGGLVKGGADAMYQFELFRVALTEVKDPVKAGAIMQVIADYNKDDCLSTKLMYDWLRTLKFDAVGQITAW
jgi:predicted RecB family nuclease